MPFTFLAHQAPVLPLKMWRPRWFSGAGLVLGSMAPDFEKFVSGDAAGRFAHSRVGIVVYCLPLSVIVYLLLTRVVAPALVRVMPDAGSFRLRDYARALAAPRRERWVAFGWSALVGAVSHVILDGFTHADPRVVALFPALRERVVLLGGMPVNTVSLHQTVASLVGGALALALMYRIGRQRRALGWAEVRGASIPPLPPAPLGQSLAFWAVVAVLTIGTTAAASLGAALADGGSGAERHVLNSIVYRLPLTGFAALCVTALLARRLWPAGDLDGRGRDEITFPAPQQPRTRAM